jgi:hypothetical protein
VEHPETAIAKKMRQLKPTRHCGMNPTTPIYTDDLSSPFFVFASVRLRFPQAVDDLGQRCQTEHENEVERGE